MMKLALPPTVIIERGRFPMLYRRENNNNVLVLFRFPREPFYTVENYARESRSLINIVYVWKNYILLFFQSPDRLKRAGLYQKIDLFIYTRVCLIRYTKE